MGAGTGLGIFLASLGDAMEGFGKRAQGTQDMRRQFEIKQGLEQINRPQEEEDFKRRTLLGMGIDPDTGQPIPGFYEAIQRKRAAMRSGGGGGGRRKSSSSGDLF